METENNEDDEAQPELHLLTRSSLRPTRSKLWDHPEEELPLLTSPLEVDSETPVADALIKRLQNEEEKEEGLLEMGNMLKSECGSFIHCHNMFVDILFLSFCFGIPLYRWSRPNKNAENQQEEYEVFSTTGESWLGPRE